MAFRYAQDSSTSQNGSSSGGNRDQQRATGRPTLDLEGSGDPNPNRIKVTASSSTLVPPPKKKERGLPTIVLDDSEEEEELERTKKDPSEEWEDYNELLMQRDREESSEEMAQTLENDKAAREKLDLEIAGLDQQIAQLQQLRSSLVREKSALSSKIGTTKPALPRATGSGSAQAAPSKAGKGVVDYSGKFPWSGKIKEKAKEVFGIDSFRLCQEQVINAAMDGREVVCIMPTGGGKSLCYQLPALLSPGTTVVITPLISLMQDQCYNLQQHDVRAEFLNAATGKDESKQILRRLVDGAGTLVKSKGKASGKGIQPMKVNAKGKGRASEQDEDDDEGDEREIKLLYVTPEKVDKAKTLISTFQKMFNAGLLARFVIDEAHCVSSLGHDYRPSYKELSKLHSLFPTVPIIAVTATAPSTVISDMLKLLLMPRQTSPGTSAKPDTTVLFTSPLYRKNLHYSVLPKPSSAPLASQAIVDYIRENHPGESGIIYCLSRADTENLAAYISKNSKIKVAVYHGYVEDAEKAEIHRKWREKEIDLVIATTAFGLGIDAPDVRYVLHSTIAKSLEGYYQESGRAGRDGKDSDCVMFFRSNDAARISTLIYSEFYSGGREKVYALIEYAENLTTCRKLAFAEYFNTTQPGSAAFESGANALDPCGHCDNCQRDPQSFELVDVSLPAYQALRVITAASAQRGTLTLAQACDLVRGLGGGSFSNTQGKNKGKGKVDVVAEAGAKVALNKDATESLLIRLLLDGLLEEYFHGSKKPNFSLWFCHLRSLAKIPVSLAASYSTISYLRPTPRALRFTRFTPDEFAKNGSPIEIKMNFAVAVKGKRKRKVGDEGTKAGKSKKQKKVVAEDDDDDPEAGEDNENHEEENDEEEGAMRGAEEDGYGQGSFLSSEGSVEVDEDGWEVPRRKVMMRGSAGVGKKKNSIQETIDLDSD